MTWCTIEVSTKKGYQMKYTICYTDKSGHYQRREVRDTDLKVIAQKLQGNGCTIQLVR